MVAWTYSVNDMYNNDDNKDNEEWLAERRDLPEIAEPELEEIYLR
jgi:hypothetical protein